MLIGPLALANTLMVAPMAGVTDRAFRRLCKRLGAGYAVGEMMTSRPELQHSRKTTCRANHEGESGLIAVQIAGTEPEWMAQAARLNIERGAQIIDINMGCPARKVCNRWAGSALMQDEPRAVAIAAAVVAACAPYQVPVTLKMRTGWSEQQRNAVALARQFEGVGIAMLTVHGRTREQGYRGAAEYQTIAAVKAAVGIPVVANGDVDSPVKAAAVLAATGADAIMVGRAALGRPWLFRQIAHYLANGELLAEPLVAEVRGWLAEHLHDHYALYGTEAGVRTARKHLGWYLQGWPQASAFRAGFNQLETPQEQLAAVQAYLDALQHQMDRVPTSREPGTTQQQGAPTPRTEHESTLS